MNKRKWRMMGWWWASRFSTIEHGSIGEGDYAAPRTFIGDIEVDDQGNFTGTMIDCHGRSAIAGKVFEEALWFEKKYSSTRSGGTDKNIVYSLLASETPTSMASSAQRAVLAGWKGVYNIEGASPLASGEAACVMFPP